jgi:hypothetical protein
MRPPKFWDGTEKGVRREETIRSGEDSLLASLMDID